MSSQITKERGCICEQLLTKCGMKNYIQPKIDKKNS